MHKDPVVQEVRHVKEEIASRYGHDLQAIAKAASERREQLGLEAVSHPPKRITAS